MKYVLINHKSYPVFVPTIGILKPGVQELDLDDRQIRYLENVSKTVVDFMPEVKTKDVISWRKGEIKKSRKRSKK